jgi:membrane protease YdiL (CAAX protease family)
MRAIIIKYPVAAFYTVAFLSAILMGWENMVFFPMLSDYGLMLPQWAPALAAVFVVLVTTSRSEVYLFIQKVFSQKAKFKWYLIALAIPVITCGISYVVFSFAEYRQYVKPVLNRPIYSYIVCFFTTVFGCYGEEIGWRGFMLPQLQKKYSLLISSLIVGFCWGFWHLSFHLGIVGFALYIFMTIEFSLIISWLYYKTKGNIMPAIILHSTINICSLVLFENIISDPLNQHLQIVLYEIYIVIFLFPCLLICFSHLSAHRRLYSDIYKRLKAERRV